ncbi:MAG: hypothetical protein QOE45_3286 [Frankiaceae bacterium]|jgi:hypothetical protein|nr:hypothetical protein [Frankiaceae bacterium]
MAQKMQVLLTCDLHEGDKPGTETIRFAVEGSNYEIDVCDTHAKQMRSIFAPYAAAGRRVSSRGGAARRGRTGSAGDSQRTQDIRTWARKKGLKVSERGRLSADLVAKWEASKGR